MRVFAHLQRTVNALLSAVLTNGLGNGQNVRFGERAVQRGTAMTAGAKTDQLGGVPQIRPALVVVAIEPRQIHKQFLWGRFTGQR